MITGSLSELFCSLTVQCLLLLLVTRWLAGRQTDCDLADRLWRSCHLLILLMSATGCLLPHLRLLPQPVWPAQLLLQAPEPTAAVVWQLLLTVWITGMLVLSVGILLSLIRTSVIIRGAVPVDSIDGLLSIGEAGPAGVPTQPAIRILVSPLVGTPFCWQLQRPVIVLPEQVLQFPPSELRTIVLHERAHLLENHPFHLFVQRLVEILFWFNPCVWSCSREAALQRELVCDRQAATNPRDIACLLKGLYRLAASQAPAVELPAGLGFASHGSAMQLRVDHLLQHAAVRPGCARPRQLLLACTAVLLMMTVWLPCDRMASDRSLLSPWPAISAVALKEAGISVRDYEIDAHRWQEHRHAAASSSATQ